jgi:non-homologous end joining protein Ku
MLDITLAVESKGKVPTSLAEITPALVRDFEVAERYPGGPHAPVPPKQAVKCATCGTERTSWHGWSKAKENADGTYAVPDADALAAASAVDESVTKLIDLTLHNQADVDRSTIRSGRVYNLEPGKDGAVKYNAYVGAVLKLQALGKVLVCMWAVSTVPAMYRLTVTDGVLVFEELAKPETVRLRPAINFPEAPESAVDMLVKVAEMGYGEFDPAAYNDQRKPLIAAAIAAGQALAAGDAPATATAPAVAKTVDPFAALAAALGMVPDPAPAPAAVSDAGGTVAPKKRAPRKKAAPAAA